MSARTALPLAATLLALVACDDLGGAWMGGGVSRGGLTPPTPPVLAPSPPTRQRRSVAPGRSLRRSESASVRSIAPRRPLLLTATLLALVACDDLGGAWMGGIGAVLRHRARDATLVVEDVPPRGNAASAGLRPGDRVIAIDGDPVAELDARTIVTRLRGPVGSIVRLTVARGAHTRTVRVERAPYR